MSKSYKKPRKDRDYFDDYSDNDSEYSKKKIQKKERRSKYYDEIDTYESHSRFNFKAQKFRI